jgi:hypothetical protein
MPAVVLFTLFTALAQAQSPNDVAMARDFFERGVAFAQAREWDEAREAFSRSYALAPRASTLINLAGAERQSGRLVAALESYRQFLREAPAGESALRDEAQAAVNELGPRLARVEIEVRNLLSTDVVKLDGHELRAASLGAAIPIDPGAHRIEVVREGVVLRERAFELAEGASDRVSIEVPPPLEDAPALDSRPAGPEDPIEEDDGGTVFESPWFWIVAGVVVAGAAVGGWFLFRPVEDPFVGNTTPGMVVNP